MTDDRALNDGVDQNGAAGVEAHFSEQDTPPSTAAGAVSDGTATDNLLEGGLPGEGGLDDAGETVAGDTTVPGADSSADEGATNAGAADDYGDGVTEMGHS
jgi:hypothetical protein